MPFEKKPYPDWSWSLSRHNVFEECHRKYLYNYYASHNGWLNESPLENQVVYRLKQITNLYLVFGEAIHEMAQYFLAKGNIESIQLDLIINEIRGKLNKAYKDSLNRLQWEKYPKKNKMLHEIYYSHKLPERVTEIIKKRIQICSENFLKSTTINNILSNQINIIEVEKLNTIKHNGTDIFVKLDLLFTINDEWIITDWKTGYEDEKNELQVKLYAYYVHKHYGIPLKKIKVHTEYLLSGDCVLDDVNEDDFDGLFQYIDLSVSQMKELLLDKDKNIPYSIDKFATTTNPIRCKMCNFREICDVKLI